MKVKVIKRFRDKLDDFKIKEAGEALEVSKERYEELITSPFGVFVENAESEDEEEKHVKEIKEVEAEEEANALDEIKQYPFPKHTGGGWYLLSNGEKIQGKEEAEKAERKLRS